MRAWVAPTVVAVALAPAPALADCAAPSIQVDPVKVAPGDHIHVVGDAFVDTAAGGHFAADLTIPGAAQPGLYSVASVHEMTELDRVEVTVKRTP